MDNDKKQYGAVIYADGSARPNPGPFGSGIHGYLFTQVSDTTKPTKIGAWVATNKGYLLEKDVAAKKAEQVCVVNYLDAFSSSLEMGTNNIGEINAVGLFFTKMKEVADSVNSVYVLSDSDLTVKGITSWLQGWLRNGWKTKTGAPVSNQKHWEALNEVVSDFKTRGVFDIAWVRGHNDNLGNVRADYLAKLGTNYSSAGLLHDHTELSEPLRYNKVDVNLHPFISLKRIYFNTDAELNMPGLYYQAGWSGQDFVFGKRTSEAAFSVVRLATPDAVLEAIVKAQCAIKTGLNTVVYAKIDRVKSADVFPYIQKYGVYCLNQDRRNLNMNFLDGKPLTIEIRPGELPVRAIDVLSHLEEVLAKFEDYYLETQTLGPKSENYAIHDVTEHFYTLSEKRVGKTIVSVSTLNKKFVVGIKKTEVVIDSPFEPGKALTLPLIFTDDIPGRNTFKHLESKEPCVYIVTWKESESVLRYATIINTNDAVGVWCNYFANQVLL